MLLIDTVGLVRRLPHHLVDAFRSTLEEAARADVLLNLCDASSSEAAEHLTVTRDLLVSLGCTDRPILTVFNKCDRLENGEELLPGEDRTALRISAKTGEGLSALLEAVAAALPPDRRRVRLLLPFREGALGRALPPGRGRGNRGIPAGGTFYGGDPRRPTARRGQEL